MDVYFCLIAVYFGIGTAVMIILPVRARAHARSVLCMYRIIKAGVETIVTWSGRGTRSEAAGEFIDKFVVTSIR